MAELATCEKRETQKKKRSSRFEPGRCSVRLLGFAVDPNVQIVWPTERWVPKQPTNLGVEVTSQFDRVGSLRVQGHASGSRAVLVEM